MVWTSVFVDLKGAENVTNPTGPTFLYLRVVFGKILSKIIGWFPVLKFLGRHCSCPILSNISN